jgi:hypothetical protein
MKPFAQRLNARDNDAENRDGKRDRESETGRAESMFVIYTFIDKKLFGLHQWPGLQTETPQDRLDTGVRSFPNCQGSRRLLHPFGGKRHFSHALITVGECGNPAFVFN